jgi:malic enzyme
VCLSIADDEDRAFQYTIKRDTVAVVSDGTAVVVMAALLNAVKLTGRRLEDLHVLIIGLGTAPRPRRSMIWPKGFTPPADLTYKQDGNRGHTTSCAPGPNRLSFSSV